MTVGLYADRNGLDTIALANEMNDGENLLLIHSKTGEELRSENAGYELMLATYVASLGTGLPAEMASQKMHEDLYEFQTSSSISSTPRTGGGGHAPIPD